MRDCCLCPVKGKLFHFFTFRLCLHEEILLSGINFLSFLFVFFPLWQGVLWSQLILTAYGFMLHVRGFGLKLLSQSMRRWSLLLESSGYHRVLFTRYRFSEISSWYCDVCVPFHFYDVEVFKLSGSVCQMISIWILKFDYFLSYYCLTYMLVLVMWFVG